ncbi:MAG: host attachment protein [Alphaproteobacteria bacterium]|nr:host attachment protein [Alphaproteobacteria bacterium]
MARSGLRKRQALVTWVLVADGGFAQMFVRAEKEQRIPLAGNARRRHYAEKSSMALFPLPEWNLRAESDEAFETGNHQRGRVFESAGMARHAAEPHEDVHEAVKRRFMKSIAGRLNKAKAEGLFARLVLVAPSKRLGELREYLNKDVLNAVMMEMSKDLTQYGKGELEKYLEKKA